jgi:hypothetical protein
MTTERLERAKRFLAIAEAGDAKREAYKAAAVEIAAYKEESGETWKGIAIPLHKTERYLKLLDQWRKSGYEAATPFLMDKQATKRAARSHAKQVLRDEPEQAAKLVSEAPPATRRAMARALAQAAERDQSEARERRVREHGKAWHDFDSEALQKLSEARRNIKAAHDAVMSARHVEQLERGEEIAASAAMTATSAEYVREAAQGLDVDEAFAALLREEA